mgnify:CR=1 FL=1
MEVSQSPFTDLIVNRVESFTISDLYTYMIMHNLKKEDISRVLIFLIYADEFQTYVLDRIQISYVDRTIIDLFTSYYNKYQGGVELSHPIKFDDLLMYCKIKITGMSVHNNRKALCFWQGHCD